MMLHSPESNDFALHNFNNKPIPDRLQSVIRVNRAILPERDKGNDADDDGKEQESGERERTAEMKRRKLRNDVWDLRLG